MILGIDETRGALPFIRLIDPTEADKARASIEAELNRRTPGIDALNPRLWSLVGFDGSAIYNFISNFAQAARDIREVLTTENRSEYKNVLIGRYRMNSRNVDTYLDVMVDLIGNGTISSAAIVYPWDYKPTEPAADIKKGVGKIVGSTLDKLLITGATVAALYLIVPKVIGRTNRNGRTA